ncbi:pyridoxamine 5'-phosphate oxidase family protein [Candidatus Microgenomates bacterium]|nr:pyridoxamine 5'-phosphate oxidase family protein [Candidatus Microgenomates bacterium]
MDIVLRKEINDFITGSSIAVLATLAPDGSPQAGIVFYYTDGEGHIYFATAKDSRKLINIQKQPQVALVIGHDVNPTELQIEGKATELTDDAKINEVIGKIAIISNSNPKTAGWPPLLSLSMKSGVTCVVIAIERFKYSNFTVHPGAIVTGSMKDLLFQQS